MIVSANRPVLLTYMRQQNQTASEVRFTSCLVLVCVFNLGVIMILNPAKHLA